MFAFRLCLALGVPHPDYLGDMLTTRQILDWFTFYGVEPFGEQYQHLLLAQLTAKVHNAWYKGRGLKAMDCLPGRYEPPPTPTEIKRLLTSARAAADGRK